MSGAPAAVLRTAAPAPSRPPRLHAGRAAGGRRWGEPLYKPTGRSCEWRVPPIRWRLVAVSCAVVAVCGLHSSSHVMRPTQPLRDTAAAGRHVPLVCCTLPAAPHSRLSQLLRCRTRPLNRRLHAVAQPLLDGGKRGGSGDATSGRGGGAGRGCRNVARRARYSSGAACARRRRAAIRSCATPRDDRRRARGGTGRRSRRCNAPPDASSTRRRDPDPSPRHAGRRLEALQKRHAFWETQPVPQFGQGPAPARAQAWRLRSQRPPAPPEVGSSQRARPPLTPAAARRQRPDRAARCVPRAAGAVPAA